jgi:hypothetical protein
MRYPAAEKLEIIRLVGQSHLPVRRTLAHLGVPPATFSCMDCSPRASVLWALARRPTCVPVSGVLGMAPAPEWQIRTRGPQPLAGPRVAPIEARLSARRSDLSPHSSETPAILGKRIYAAAAAAGR